MAQNKSKLNLDSELRELWGSSLTPDIESAMLQLTEVELSSGAKRTIKLLEPKRSKTRRLSWLVPSAVSICVLLAFIVLRAPSIESPTNGELNDSELTRLSFLVDDVLNEDLSGLKEGMLDDSQDVSILVNGSKV